MNEPSKPPVGFIGVGAMGGPMARHLLAAGYKLTSYDKDPSRLVLVQEAGATSAGSEAEVVAAGEIVCLSLPSSAAFVSVAESVLLPQARAGQVFLDFGTTTPPETRRIAAALAQKGAALFEAPVSGGAGGAERASLRIFAGGDPEVYERVRPLLIAVGGEARLTYCGPSGAGQMVKGVNQLAMGLGAAAYLEAVAFGVRAGISPDIINAAVGGGPEPWRALITGTARAASENRAEEIGVKFRELPYFLEEAEQAGFTLPLTRVLYDFCDAGPRVVEDDNRPAPSFWRQLQQRFQVETSEVSPKNKAE